MSLFQDLVVSKNVLSSNLFQNDQSVLKFADAVLKGYATAISVVLTGVLSMVLFGTELNALYFLGIGNVICAVFLYSANDLDRLLF